MSPTATEIFEAARQLSVEEQEWLIQALQTEELAAWQKEVGEPEAGYEEWFRASVEEALADTSPGIPHEEAMRHFHDAIQRTARLKNTA